MNEMKKEEEAKLRAKEAQIRKQAEETEQLRDKANDYHEKIKELEKILD